MFLVQVETSSGRDQYNVLIVWNMSCKELAGCFCFCDCSSFVTLLWPLPQILSNSEPELRPRRHTCTTCMLTFQFNQCIHTHTHKVAAPVLCSPVTSLLSRHPLLLHTNSDWSPPVTHNHVVGHSVLRNTHIHTHTHSVLHFFTFSLSFTYSLHLFPLHCVCACVCVHVRPCACMCIWESPCCQTTFASQSLCFALSSATCWWSLVLTLTDWLTDWSSNSCKLLQIIFIYNNIRCSWRRNIVERVIVEKEASRGKRSVQGAEQEEDEEEDSILVWNTDIRAVPKKWKGKNKTALELLEQRWGAGGAAEGANLLMRTHTHTGTQIFFLI